jgi:hypothetical protein
VLSEYDVVRLKSASSTMSVPAGTRGTVLIIHDAIPPAYEIEFIDDAGNTLAILTLKESELDIESRQSHR